MLKIHTYQKKPHVFSEYICLYRRKHKEKGLNGFTPKYGAHCLMDLWNVVSVQSLNSGPTVTGASPGEKPFLFGGPMSLLSWPWAAGTAAVRDSILEE